MSDIIVDRLFIRNATTQIIEFNADPEIESIRSVTEVYLPIAVYEHYLPVINPSSLIKKVKQ